MEIWKDIKEYEGLYQVSNLGRVKSLPRLVTQWNRFQNITYSIPEKILSLQIVNNYYSVKLSKKGKIKSYRVHRLVAEAFIDNPDNLPEVNHKDENKLNNNIDNLEWCTRQYNNTYNNHNAKINAKKRKKVICVETKQIYNSITEAEILTGYTHISDVCLGTRNTAGGYHWKFI